MTSQPEPLREVIARHGLQASKALGQNFILDRQLLARIAAVPGPLAGQTAYEVGPGPGGLTHALLEAGASVVAVERDRRCIPALSELEALYPSKLRVLESDALTVDERTGMMDLWRLVRGVKGVTGGKDRMVTVPIANPGYSVSGVGSTVLWDEAKAKAMFRALREDRPLPGS